MTQFGGKPSGGVRADGDPYAFWDGAYVLGSLSSTERREYETHLGGCPRCREAVSKLSGLPALLALMDRDDIASLDGDQPVTPPLRPELRESLLARVRRRRRRLRALTWAAVAAAAAIVAVGLALAVRPVASGPPAGSPQAAWSVVTLQNAVPGPLDAAVLLISQRWGTSVEVKCTYRDSPGDTDDHDDGDDKLALVVVGRDGSHTPVATWLAQPGVTALPTGSISVPISGIAAIQVVSADKGNVLLSQTL
jgi:hypothetical protein